MIERITPKEARRRLARGWTYVDVRSVREFDLGHLPGAYNVPLMTQSDARGLTPNGEFMAIMEACFPRERPLVIGCRSGGRSLRAAEMLAAAGYEVVDQRAGFSGAGGWVEEGFPLTTGPDPERGYAALRAQLVGADARA